MHSFPAREYRPRGWVWLIIGLAVIFSLVMLYLPIRSLSGLATLQYELSPAALTITYGWERVTIPRGEITSVRVITPTKGIRRNGTGMPGLQHGHYSYAETGSISMYSTSTRPLTVIETTGRTYGISPSDPEAFQAALAQGQTGTWEPVRPQNPAGMAVLFAIPLLITLGVPFLFLYLLRMSRTMQYTLTDEGLRITAGWNELRLAYRDMRDVRLESLPGSPWKVLGAAMPGLYWGGFHWKAAGPSLRLYSTHYKPLVLISSRRGTFGVSPAEPEAFIAELRQRIAPPPGAAPGAAPARE